MTTARFGAGSAVIVIAIFSCALLLIGGCTRQGADKGGAGNTTTSALSGEIRIDGSSTVFPLSEAYAEEFMRANPGVRVTVGSSGTGGGFKKFGNKEVDISGASRPIKTGES